MRFIDQHGFIGVDLPDRLLARMRRLSKSALPNETGGILIGRYEDDMTRAAVHSITGPPRDSVAGPATFRRGVHGLDRLLARVWKEGLYYLGEWHFHPEHEPRASRVDELQVRDFATTPSLKCPEPLLVVAGMPVPNHMVAVYLFKQRLIELSPADPWDTTQNRRSAAPGRTSALL